MVFILQIILHQGVLHSKFSNFCGWDVRSMNISHTKSYKVRIAYLTLPVIYYAQFQTSTGLAPFEAKIWKKLSTSNSRLIVTGAYIKKHVVWYRYIDDIFLIWTHGDDKLQKFLTYVDSFSDAREMKSEIRFEVNKSENEDNFLV